MRTAGLGVGVTVGEGVMLGVAVIRGSLVVVGDGSDFEKGLLARNVHADATLKMIIAVNTQKALNENIFPCSCIIVRCLRPRMFGKITHGMKPVNVSL
jgi:hypothetical protein